MYGLVSDEEDTDEDLLDEWYDVMSGLADHPLDINTATREELELIPFLNDRQIEDICEYIYRYDSMKTTGELALIESLDRPGDNSWNTLSMPETTARRRCRRLAI